MEHLVRFTTAEGRNGHHSAESLDEALQFAERVRNTEEATDVRVFRLQEVPISFKACYKVEVEAADAAVESPRSEDPPSLPEAPPVETGADGGDADDALVHHGNGRRLFSRG